jgi:hypothetical protein
MSSPTSFPPNTITIPWEDDEALCDNDIRRYPASLQAEFFSIKQDATTTVSDMVFKEKQNERGTYEWRVQRLTSQGNVTFSAIDHYRVIETEHGGRENDMIWRQYSYWGGDAMVIGVFLKIFYEREDGDVGFDWDDVTV